MIKKLEDTERVHVKAGQLLLAGKSCSEVAKEVGVSRQTVNKWKIILNEGGIDALRAVGDRGRPAKLNAQQFERLRYSLLESPTEHGFGAELWTLKRVRLLIERMFGVSYSQVHVWRILGTLRPTSQKLESSSIKCGKNSVQEFKKKT